MIKDCETIRDFKSLVEWVKAVKRRRKIKVTSTRNDGGVENLKRDWRVKLKIKRRGWLRTKQTFKSNWRHSIQAAKADSLNPARWNS